MADSPETSSCAECDTQRAENARLRLALAEERARLADLVALDRFTDVVLAANDHRELLRSAVQAAVPALGDWCTINYVPGPGEAPELAVAHGDEALASWVDQLERCLVLRPSGEPAVTSVMRSGRAFLVDPVDEQAMARILSRWVVDLDGVLEALEHLGVASVLSVPLRTRRAARGAMWLMASSPDRSFGPADIARAEVAARRLSEALDNVWNLEQQRHISATLQRALLPPRLPRIAGVEVAVRYAPAGSTVEAGGDFYDVFESSVGTWALLIGDVCGTGPDAAALTGIARHTVRAAARHGQDHVAVLEWLNEAMARSNRDLFCTALYGSLVGAGSHWTLRTASAGHPLPIHARPGEGAAIVGRPGALLGVFERITPHVAEIELVPGDLVVLYTDGVTDLPPPAGRTAEEVAAMIGALPPSMPAEAVADAIQDWVASRLPRSERGDDLALVVLRIVEGPGEAVAASPTAAGAS